VNRSHIWGDRAFKVLCEAAAVLIILIAFLLVAVLLWRSWLAIETFGGRFFIDMKWDPEPTHRKFGALAFVWGTVITSVIAMVIAVPLGVGTAVYLAEVASARVRQAGSFLVEMLAVIPSVVYGFWGLTVLSPFLQWLLDLTGGPNIGGVGILPAGLILAIMIVPYIASVSFDVIRAVPRSQREGALALGSTRWQTIWNVVLPYARPGIIGGCFLALGRALGETMAVTMLIGNKAYKLVGDQSVLDFSVFAQGNTIASVIANEFTEAGYDLYLSALVELGLVLMAVAVLFSAVARFLIARVARPQRLARPGSWWTSLAGLAVGLVPAWLGFRALSAPEPPPLLVGLKPAVFGALVVCVVLALGLLLWRVARCRADLNPLRTSFGPALCLGLLVGTAALLATMLRHGWMIDLRQEEGLEFSVGLTTFVVVLLLLQAGGELISLSLTRHRMDWLMTKVAGLCLAVTVGVLFLVVGYLVVQGATSLNLAFFTQLPRAVGQPGGGMANALVGSVMLVGMAALFAVPIGLLAAIYLAEYKSGWLGSTTRFIAEMLGAVPSIVIGLFGYYAVVFPLKTLTNNQVSFCAWAGAFALGVMMLPVVLRASEEALRLVPKSLREASHALGAGHRQTITRVLVPAALPAIITAIFLSIARVAGETAPLLLTAGWNSFWARSPNDFTPSLPYFIYSYAISSSDEWHRQAWAAALVLVVVVMALNFGVRMLAGKRVIQASHAD
jgi:phosphate ABC transporter permease protein PstC/phosphate ABC transporter permease subunit PstA